MPDVKKTFKTTIVRDGSMCFIPVTFDPAPVFGKLRAPVKVTLNGYTFRSTIASMGNGPCLPFRRSNREAAGLEGNETLSVTLELDTEPRTVEAPADLVSALEEGGAWAAWEALSYSHHREHVEAIEGAKQPETRARRIAAAVQMVAARPAKAKASNSSKAKPSTSAKAKTTSSSKAKAGSSAKAKPGSSAKAKPSASAKAKSRTSAKRT